MATQTKCHGAMWRVIRCEAGKTLLSTTALWSRTAEFRYRISPDWASNRALITFARIWLQGKHGGANLASLGQGSGHCADFGIGCVHHSYLPGTRGRIRYSLGPANGR